MKSVYNNFIFAELLDSDPLNDVIFYSSFNGWHDPLNLKFARIVLSDKSSESFYVENDIVLVNPTKIVFYESSKKVIVRNDAIVCGYDNEKKCLRSINKDVILKINDKNNENLNIMLLNFSLNENEIFNGTLFDIDESMFDNDETKSLKIGDDIVVAQTDTKIDIAANPYIFKKISYKNDKFVVTSKQNIIAKL